MEKYIYIIAYTAGSCTAPYSEYGSQCVRFAPDAGTQNHRDSVLHCRVNGGEMARLSTSDAYKTGTMKYCFFFSWILSESSAKTNILINTHIF